MKLREMLVVFQKSDKSDPELSKKKFKEWNSEVCHGRLKCKIRCTCSFAKTVPSARLKRKIKHEPERVLPLNSSQKTMFEGFDGC